MQQGDARRTARLTAVQRGGEQVTPLELFFDLVFVLAITQCTALMAAEPTWRGLAKGLLVLGVLWWSWVGYAWLTSVVDPEEGSVRLVLFAAMASLLVVSLCVPGAFDDLGPTFAVAYGTVRAAHIALFLLASRGEPVLRRSVLTLAASTALGVGILLGAAFAEGSVQGGLWALALGLDMAGPYFFGAEGWRLVPGHFAERHGLIVIIALGESVVAIGVGAGSGVDGGVIVAAVLGIALVAGMWWAYFDVVAQLCSRRLAATPAGRERNELARDLYSYLHFPMAAGIVLVALGLKTTLAHVGDHLRSEPAVALVGGLALYVAGLVAASLRSDRVVKRQRVLLVAALCAVLPVATALPALATVAVITALLGAMVAYETLHDAEARYRIRHQGA